MASVSEAQSALTAAASALESAIGVERWERTSLAGELKAADEAASKAAAALVAIAAALAAPAVAVV